MNNDQHEKLRKVNRARSQVHLKQHEYHVATTALKRAQLDLREAIAADPTAWEAENA